MDLRDPKALLALPVRKVIAVQLALPVLPVRKVIAACAVLSVILVHKGRKASKDQSDRWARKVHED